MVLNNAILYSIVKHRLFSHRWLSHVSLKIEHFAASKISPNRLPSHCVYSTTDSSKTMADELSGKLEQTVIQS